MELDRLMPEHDVEKRHDRLVAAPPTDVWDSLIDLDFNDSRLVRALMTVRGIGRRNLGWGDFERFGFVPLHREPPHELVFGLIAQPWRIRGGIVSATPETFTGYAEPGFAVIGWNYVLAADGAGTRVITMTRVRCTDAASRAKFRRYWTLVGPFSGAIRTESLRLIARGSEPQPTTDY